MPIRGGAIINIAGTTPVDDPEYRYKTEAVFGKIEGRGNGIKTVIPNIKNIGQSLHRPPAEVNKFFGCELGAQTTYNPDTEKAVVNGAHTDATLQALMHRYIEAFVICPNCRLPETDYKIKSELIYHRCAACGAKEMLDMNHKLCTFILAQDKKDKKANKGNKKKDKKKKAEKGDSSDDEKKKKKKKEKKKKKDKKKDKKDNSDSSDDSDDEGEGSNYLKDAMFGKKEETLEDQVDDASLDSEGGVDDEGALALAIDATKKWIEEHPEFAAHDLAEVVTNQQMASALKSPEKCRILIFAAFTADFFKNKEVEKYAATIRSVTNSNTIMERHLIAALEAFCVEKPKNLALFLKQLFDEDALEEATILQWAEEGRNDYTLDVVDEDTRAQLRSETEPVIVWLQEAESDDSDSESGSDEGSD